MSKGGGGAGSGARSTSFAREQDLSTGLTTYRDLDPTMSSEAETLAWLAAQPNAVQPADAAWVSSYTANGYKQINPYLRGGAAYGAKDIADLAVPALDRAIASGKTTEPVQVYRGINSPKLYGMIAKGTLSTGYLFGDNGYVSTSVVRRLARDFASNFGKQSSKPVLVTIRLPVGTPALVTQGFKDKAALKASGGSNEYELLLPRGSRFRVSAVEPSAIWGGKTFQRVTLDWLGANGAAGG